MIKAWYVVLSVLFLWNFF